MNNVTLVRYILYHIRPHVILLVLICNFTNFFRIKFFFLFLKIRKKLIEINGKLLIFSK